MLHWLDLKVITTMLVTCDYEHFLLAKMKGCLAGLATWVPVPQCYGAAVPAISVHWRKGGRECVFQGLPGSVGFFITKSVPPGCLVSLFGFLCAGFLLPPFRIPFLLY